MHYNISVVEISKTEDSRDISPLLENSHGNNKPRKHAWQPSRYRQLKMICPYKSAMMDWSEERRSVCGGAVYKLASATQGAKYKIIILQQTTNFFTS